MTLRCHLKACSYFGEVDNMQMICDRTHENILKQWDKSFPKQLEMPGSIHRYQGPKRSLSYFNSSPRLRLIPLVCFKCHKKRQICDDKFNKIKRDLKLAFEGNKMHLGTSRGSDRWTSPLPHILISCSPISKLRLRIQGRGTRGTILLLPH